MNPRNRYALTAIAVSLAWAALYIGIALHPAADSSDRQWTFVVGGLLGVGNYVAAALLRKWLARVTWAHALLATPVHLWCIFTSFFGPIYSIGIGVALVSFSWSELVTMLGFAVDAYLTTLLKFIASDSIWLIAPLSAASVEALWFGARAKHPRPGIAAHVSSAETDARIQ
jgi:hypothetical protein